MTFEGLDSVTYYAESEELKEFIANPKAGVTAKSGDTDLTDRITVMGQVSEQIMEGTNYTLAYVVETKTGLRLSVIVRSECVCRRNILTV